MDKGAWRAGGLQSIGLQRVRHNWVTDIFTFTLPWPKVPQVKWNLLSCVRLFVISWTVPRQAPLSLGFSRQEYWSGLPFPYPGDLPDPGIEAESPALQADSLPSAPPEESEKSILISWHLKFQLRVVEPDFFILGELDKYSIKCFFKSLSCWYPK